MNKKKYSFMRGLVSKISLALVFALIGIVNTVAENTLKIDNFSIKPGETKLVAVNLNNTDKITSLQADFTLPAGLTCSTELATNTDRLDREEQTASLTQQKTAKGDYTNTFRLVILAQSIDSNPIMGNSGTIVFLKITAAKDFNAKRIINVTTVYGSDAESNKLSMANSDTEVTPQVATIATTGNFSIKPDSTFKKIDVILNNDVDIYGLQVDVTLPVGVSIENKANSTRYKFIYADRLPSDATVNATNLGNGKVRLILSALSHTAITNGSGVIFSFNVNADKDLAEASNIVFDNVIVSDVNDVAYEIGQTNNIIVTNAYLAQYVPLKAKLNALKAAYETAGIKIAKDCADVVKDSAIVAQGKKIGSLIAAVQTTIEGAYAKDSLANDSVSIISKMKQAQSEVDEWVINATVTEKAFVDAKAKKEANEAANTKLTAAIASVQAKLDAAKTTIATDCKDVVDQFVSTEKGIQTKIDSVKVSVKAQYDAVKLTAESVVDTVTFNAAIAKMVTDAIAAEKVFVDAKKKEANEAANTKLTAAISSVQAKLDAATTTIATNCKNVVDRFIPVEKGIQTKIDSIKASVKELYDATKLTAESTINTVDVEAAISKLIADATAAEKAFSIPGDVDGDGLVEVNDYNAIKNFVLEITETPEVGTKEFYAADVKADQVINIGDVTAVIKIINNASNTASGAKAMLIAPVAATADAISLSTEGEDNTRRIAINLSNSISYVGCQMDIKLPAGVTLLGESLSSRANGHNLSSNDLSNGLHRILISDLNNSAFSNNKGAFVYLDVAVTGNSSVDDIAVSNILFTDADVNIYHFADLSNSTTGINTVKSESGCSKIYSVGGKLMNTLQRGVNIIRNADGSSKKIIKK